MKLLAAFLRLIRSVNLLFIAITQLLFQYWIVAPVFNRAHAPLVMSWPILLVLVLASACIAAGGYIINDYFDLNIDRVNKPGKLVVDKVIKRRWAILWHLCLSGVGLILSAIVAWKTRAWWLILVNTGCVGALWFYSTTFKKKLLSGNIIISLLTAWVILVIGFITHYTVLKNPDIYAGIDASKLLRRTFLYAGFAFMISLVREVVEGHRGYARRCPVWLPHHAHCMGRECIKGICRHLAGGIDGRAGDHSGLCAALWMVLGHRILCITDRDTTDGDIA
jgi:4-hydroxybenzoate polyprenyltransferase and related prenyltransferases